MKKEIVYEWAIEHVDENGDIQDLDHHDDFMSAWVEPVTHFGKNIALSRNKGNEEDGLCERGYAYIKNKSLEQYFCSGHKVPEKFLQEVKKVFDTEEA